MSDNKKIEINNTIRKSVNFRELKDFQESVRCGDFCGHTSGLFQDKAQFNLVILPQKYGEDFNQFCKLNPTPCPLIFKGEPGQYLFPELGDVDIRRDVPAYWIYRDGAFSEERQNIEELWEDDFIAFFIGCSFTFEYALLQKGITLRHVEQSANVAMYKSNLDLNASEYFSGKMVVSMRWIKPNQVDEAIRISGEYPHFHGKPVHHGDYREIGIADITKPDYGDYVSPGEGEVAVFWGCGVTPQNSIQAAKLPLVITHRPGSMVISNLSHQEVLKRSFNG